MAHGSPRRFCDRSTLDPGDPELRLSVHADTLNRADVEHGGLARIYVEVAGDSKPVKRKVPADVLAKVRSLRR
jgi:hypothetical protein